MNTLLNSLPKRYCPFLFFLLLAGATFAGNGVIGTKTASSLNGRDGTPPKSAFLNLYPSCTNLTSPVNGAANVAVTSALTWAVATNTPTGYRLNVGTTPGGTDILNNFNAGNVLTYNPPGDFPGYTTIYVKITPFNANGDAVDCVEESFTTTGLLSNPSACQLSIPIPDNSCTAANKYLINVATAPGNQLGTNVVLTNVKIIVAHNNDADLDIRLYSPNNTMVELSTDNGGTGNNYGNPADLTCAQVTNFSMGAGTAITAGTAPFIGTYIPEGSFTTFNNGSNPVGTWTLEICDDEAPDAGMLKFVELVFAALPSCTSLTSPTNGASAVPANTTLTWAAATGSPTGYRLDVGTTPGGTDILNNFDVGNVTTYDPPGFFPYGATVYVKIKPYNTNGSANGCSEQSFGTANCIANLVIVSMPVPSGTYKSLGDLVSNNSSIANGTVVTFLSDTGVLLDQEFVVELGGVFEANIQSCATASPIGGVGEKE